ncbi:type I restriction endonuclease subunit R [Paraburkholderia sp. BR10954]|uniref:type I restriction endonuclease subunit R n=1 Tax=Paraburkholderia sp. BR10954 TaxID=3236995 RepID=UPI0034D36348
MSQLPAAHLLQKLGWVLLTPAQAVQLRGGRKSRVLLRLILEQQLATINAFEFGGRTHTFDRAAIEEAIRALENLPDDGLVRTNERVWHLLRLGKGIPQTVDGDTKSFQLQYIDWDHPERNVYHVADEFEVEAGGTTDTRRPDLVLFVNGIPFVVIECKRSTLPPGKVPIDEAISQMLRNQGPSEIPRLFHYAQLLLALAVNEASYAAAGTSAKFWQTWREQSDESPAIEALMAEPLTQDQQAATFDAGDHRFGGSVSSAEAAGLWWESQFAAGRSASAQDRLLYALCRPRRLLELSRRFTIFDAGVRKVARYQQYFAIKAIVDRISTLDVDGVRAGGVVWHTQGSGKSLTMVMLAETILESFAVLNPRILLVTDRVDLDDQIYGTFKGANVEITQATTGRHLLELLDSPRTQVITTLIHKFETALKGRSKTLDSADIFVLVDESHRSQSGQFHAAMRRVLPKACFIGFTGTPIFSGDLPTVQRFGGLIGEPYTIDKAVADGAVVPLMYEGRYVHQQVDQISIDEWFKRYTSGLTDLQRADLKRKYSSAGQLNRTEQKIRAIAWDISTHYATNFHGTGLKGQLVAPSKADALLYKRFLDEFRMIASEVLISPPDTREGFDDVDERANIGRPDVVEFWAHMMKRFGSDERYQKDLIERFKNADEPEIIIVVDKLLTGFDAPRNGVLYLTRSLKDHTLLQAIARVNRVYEGKDYGLIVDYYGIIDHLGEALEVYTASKEELKAHLEFVLTDIDKGWQNLDQLHSQIWETFKQVRNKSDQEAMEKAVADPELRQHFYVRLSRFARTLKLATASVDFHEQTPSEKIERYRKDLRYFMGLRASVARRYAESVDFKQYQAAIQKLLDTYIGAGQVETIVEPVDIFDRDAFRREVEQHASPEGQAEVIANRVRKTITERLEEDPVFYQRFSELIDRTLREYEEQRFEQLELLRRMNDIADRVRERRAFDDVPERLRDKDIAKAYFDIVQQQLGEAKPALPREVAADAALMIDEIVRSKRKVDWTLDMDIQNQMRIAIEDGLFALKQKDGLDLDFKTIDHILDRCIDVAKRRIP